MWWSILVSPAWAMTSGEAVDAALERSPVLEVAEARVAEAEAKVGEIRAKILPSASLEASYGFQTEVQLNFGDQLAQLFPDDPVNVPPTTVVPDRLFAGVGRFTIPLFAPQGWVAIGLTKDAADLARTEGESERAKVAKAVLEAWHTAYAAQSLLTEAQRGKELATRLLEKGQKLAELGAIASQDLIPFRRAIATADGQVGGASAALAAARGVLHLLTGLDEAPTEPVLPESAPDLASLVAQIDRPDVRAAEERVDVASKLVSVERLARVPTIGIGGGAAYLNPQPELVGKDIVWRVGLSAAIPLFQGGAVTARANEASAQAAQAEAGARALRQLAEIEVRTAHGTLSRALTVLQQQETAVQLAQEAAEASEKRMGEGGGTIVQLQQLQLELIIAEAQRLAARADAAKAADMLTLAVHGAASG